MKKVTNQDKVQITNYLVNYIHEQYKIQKDDFPDVELCHSSCNYSCIWNNHSSQ